MINTYSESIFESVRFLNEDKQNFDIFINEIMDMQCKANEMNCYLVLESGEINRILDWIKEKWKALLELINKKKNEFLELLSQKKNESIDKALDILSKKDDTFFKDEKYYVSNTNLDKALDALNKLEDFASDITPKLCEHDIYITKAMKVSNSDLYFDDVCKYISDLLGIQNYAGGNINAFYRNFIGYNDKTHISNKFQEMKGYNLYEIKSLINSIKNKNEKRLMDYDKVKQNYNRSDGDSKEVAADHVLAYSVLTMAELNMYECIFDFLSQYTLKTNMILIKSKLGIVKNN